MKSLQQCMRLMHIYWILARNGFDKALFSTGFFPWLSFFMYLNPWNWFRKASYTRGEALRVSFEELGPIFIKLGQALSTRPDIFPKDIVDAFALLRDKVPPFAGELALRMVEETFGKPALELFAAFDVNVLAAASISQVHRAKLLTGEEVIVKILRPGIHKTIQKDLALMQTLAALVDRYWPESKRFKPKEIVAEFAHNLVDELDLQREAANAALLRRNFHASPLLYVPEVYWDYTSKNILVAEYIQGIPVSQLSTLKEYGINLKKLAERGVEIFFTQVFRDSFFHADMHPGNIFVSYQHPEDPQYLCVDFGIMGVLSDNDKHYLAQNLLAFFRRDYKEVARLHIVSGWVRFDTRVEDFESAIRTVCEPIFKKPLKDISFSKIVLHLLEVARKFHMEVQPQLILLQKTLFTVEGLGRVLCPELNLWESAKPFLEKWVKKEMGFSKIYRQLQQDLPFYIYEMPKLPRLLQEVLDLHKEKLLRTVQETPSPSSLPRLRKGIGWGVLLGVGLMGIVSNTVSLEREMVLLSYTLLVLLGALMAFL